MILDYGGVEWVVVQDMFGWILKPKEVGDINALQQCIDSIKVILVVYEISTQIQACITVLLRTPKIRGSNLDYSN